MTRAIRSLIPCLLLLAASGSAVAAETAGPIEVVEKAYVDGVHRNADAEAMRAGFDPEFVMFVNTDDGVRQVTLDEWAGRIAEAGARPDRQTPSIEADLSLVGETDDAAVVRVELKRDGRHVFTDFLSLYRTGDGWKIVGKIYQDRR